MASKWEIEKGVPLPEPRKTVFVKGCGFSKGTSAHYPWAEMEVGDSIWVPRESQQTQSNMRSVSSLWGKRNGKEFATRVVVENGIKVVRVWRVS